MVSRDSMAAAVRRCMGMSLPAVRPDDVRRLVRRDVAVQIGEISAGWSAGIRDSSFPYTLASVVKSAEQDGMMDIENIC